MIKFGHPWKRKLYWLDRDWRYTILRHPFGHQHDGHTLFYGRHVVYDQLNVDLRRTTALDYNQASRIFCAAVNRLYSVVFANQGPKRQKSHWP